jgi:hypothetical protein
MQNTVKLLDTDVIYVEMIGPQTERSMLESFAVVDDLVVDLQRRKKRVLILSDSTHEGSMDEKALAVGARIATHMDFDKSANFGRQPYVAEVRKQMIADAGMSHRVGEFKTRKAALAWLLEK